MKKSILMLILAILLSLPATLLAAGGSKDTIVYAAYADIKDWDPSVAASMEVVMLSSVYETLTVYDTYGAKNVKPGLATSWSTSDDGLIWTFNLRKGVKFHDGTP
ncbi:MAG: ABC transporter substrate-binding protein, partial [Deltaproteobacteria bacterium]|nr:ABC transporter substrate-binding protein [Deltaproteobacteria bacterium]